MSAYESGGSPTTRIGYVNRNGQRCCGTLRVPGSDHLQVAYRMECERPGCGAVYGANGTDVFQRRCPRCQSGAPGIPFAPEGLKAEIVDAPRQPPLTTDPLAVQHGSGVSDSTILGAAGEHYVMCQLLRRGLIAALAPVGVPNTDIVVTDRIGALTCAVQVKTRQEKGSDGGWHMGAKHEALDSPMLFYVFVDFGTSLEAHSVCWVVPAPVVARTIRESHELWLKKPGKRGQQRKDGKFRRFLPDYDRVELPELGCGAGWLEQFREAWGLIAGDP